MACIAPVKVSSPCPVCLLFCNSPCKLLRMMSNERHSCTVVVADAAAVAGGGGSAIAAT